MAENKKNRRWWQVIFSLLMKLLVGVFGLLIIITLLLNIPAIQTYLTSHISNYLEKKLETTVRVEAVKITLPKTVVLEGVYVEEQNKDTLLYLGYLGIDVSLFGLMRHEISVNNIGIENLVARVHRKVPENIFNFQFIIDAFVPADTLPLAKDTTDTKAQPWQISADGLVLKKINLRYYDDDIGINAILNLGQLEIDIKTMDLNELAFFVKELSMENTTGSVEMWEVENAGEEDISSEEPVADTSYLLPFLGLDHLIIDNVNLSYVHRDWQYDFRADIGKLEFNTDKIDLNEQEIKVDNLFLGNSNLMASMPVSSLPQETVSSTDSLLVKDSTLLIEIPNPFPDWDISANDLELENINAKYDDINATKTEGLDFGHVDVEGLNLNVGDAGISADKANANIRHLRFNEKSGLKLNSLSADVSASDQFAKIKALNFETNKTDIKADLSVQMASISSLEQNMRSASFSLNLDVAKLGWDDVFLLMPSLEQDSLIKKIKNFSPKLKLNTKGRVDDLRLELVNLMLSDSTQLRLSGDVKGLPDFNELSFDLSLDTLMATKKDMLALLDPSLITGIPLPERVGLNAGTIGKTDSLSVNVNFSSNLGGFVANAWFDQSGPALRDTFHLQLEVKDFDASTFLADTTLGPVNLTLHASGAGAMSDSITAKLETTIRQPEFNGYVYQDFLISASMQEMIFAGHLQSDDPNADFELSFNADLSNERKNFDLDLDLSLLNLYALHLLPDKTALTTKFTASANYLQMDDLDAEIRFSKINIYQDEMLLPVGSASFITRLTPDSSYINIQSKPLSANIESNISSVELEPIFHSAVRKYLNLKDTVGLPPDKNLTYEVKFNRDEKARLPMVPELKKLVVDEFSGSYSSNSNQLITKVVIPKLKYNSIVLDSINISLNGLEDSLALRAGFRKLAIDTLWLDYFLIGATINKGEIFSGLRVGNNIDSARFFLRSKVDITDNGFKVGILPKGLLFDGHRWEVPENNYLMIDQENIYSENFSFTSEGQGLAVNINDAGAELEFDKFDIGNITNIFSYGTHKQLMHGGLDGKVSLPSGSNDSHLVADLEFNSLYVLDTLVGKVKLMADYKEGLLDLDVGLDNPNNKISLKGSIDQKAEQYDLKAAINFTDLGRLERFAMGEVSQMSGAINGELALKGSFDNPGMQGLIKFSDAHFNITKINFITTLKNESLRFDKKGIHFDEFTITDAAQKSLDINGSILTTNYSDFAFDLHVNANRFQPVNSTKADNPHFFGSLIMDTDIKIKGDMDLPRVEADLKIDKGTNLTYVLPGSEIELITPEGTVNFVNPNLRIDTLFKQQTGDYITDSIISKIKGIDLSASFQLDPAARFTLFIDPTSGDYATVGGKANLNISIDESGAQSITGIFEVSDGIYQISFYGLVKKSFTINPGSTIAWSGRPMDANLGITAKYIVRASSTALVANESASMSQAELDMFKQRLPYEVLLNINGFLAEPDVSFNINLPDKYLVNYPMIASKLTKLNTPEMQSELNKQVFALLVTGSFIADNPLASDGSSTNIATTAARNSVNGILADQMNNISNRYVKFVDLNFGLTTFEDYSSGSSDTRTELDVKVSKKLLDDRLEVEASGTFDLEGDSKKYTGQTSQNTYGEFSATYALNQSREYKLRIFRENAYDIFDGEVAYSGVAFIFEKSFDKLRKRDKKKKPKENNKEGMKEENLQNDNE